MSKVGIMGGTFNPPHLGHLHAATRAHEALGLDRVLFIPTATPPHKALPHGSATPAQRCEMVRLMVRDLPWARVDEIELARGGTSYTVDTLQALKDRGEGALYLLIGSDMLLDFDTRWRAPAQIARLCTLVVCARETGERAALEEKAAALRTDLGAEIVLLEGAPLSVSSTDLRCGRADERLLDPAVARYIRQKGLYDSKNFG